MMPKHILAWSGGKDSTACAILARIHNLPIDGIITLRPDPFKIGLSFTDKFEDFMGMPVQVIDGPTFEDSFYLKKGENAKYLGFIYGWPMTIYRTCSRIMKTDPIVAWQKQQSEDTVMVVGIAIDEPERLQGLRSTKDVSYLEQFEVTEKEARSLCEEHGLLNPLYEHFDRIGCVRCPKQGLDALRKVRRLEPEKWQWCLDHDDESPVTFKPSGRTFKEIDYRIRSGKWWADGRTREGRLLNTGQMSYLYHHYCTIDHH